MDCIIHGVGEESDMTEQLSLTLRVTIVKVNIIMFMDHFLL